MKKWLFLFCLFFLFQGTSQANRDSVSNVTYATDLIAPYSINVNLNNKACGTTKNFSGNIFDILGNTGNYYPTCQKNGDKLKCTWSRGTSGGVPGTIDSSIGVYATNKQILQELGTPAIVSSQVSGTYMQNISFQMWLITDTSGANSGSPYQVHFGTYNLLGGDNTIVYSDPSECGKTEVPTCGTANKTYAHNDNSWSADDIFCNNAHPDPSLPIFPSEGGEVQWKCGTGTGAVNCKANRGTSTSNPACGGANNHVFKYNETSYVGYSQCNNGTPSSNVFPLQGEMVNWKCVTGSTAVDCSANREQRFDNVKHPPIIESVEIPGCTKVINGGNGKFYCMSDTNKLTLKVKFSSLGNYGTPPEVNLVELAVNNEANTTGLAIFKNTTKITTKGPHSLGFNGNAGVDFKKTGKYALEVVVFSNSSIIASKSDIYRIDLEIIPNNNFIYLPLDSYTTTVKGIYNPTNFDKTKICGLVTDSNDNKLLNLSRTVKVSLVGIGIDLNSFKSGWDGEALKIVNTEFVPSTSKYCFELGSYAPGKNDFGFNVKINKHTDVYKIDSVNYHSGDIATNQIEFKKPLAGKMMSSFDSGATWGEDIKLGKPTLYKILPKEIISYGLTLRKKRFAKYKKRL